MNKKIFIPIFVFLILAFSSMQKSSVTADVYSNSCTPYGYSLSYGMRGGDVARLQQFLISYNYLSSGLATGYFGRVTQAAVTNFQASNGIPATGFVGPLTRDFIYKASCGGTYTDTSYPQYIPPTSTSQPTINSLSQSSGPFGTVVTIYGSNFSRNNQNSINFAGVSNIITGISSYDGTSLQFTIPASPCPQGQYICTMQALSTGGYSISVTTPYGTSNGMTFTITDYSWNNGNTTNRPTINSIDGPTSLTVNQEHTWTIRATDPSNRNLTYSVDWGDGQSISTGYSNTLASFAASQSVTFSHRYDRVGYFTIRIVARSESGLTAESSVTVYVRSTDTSYDYTEQILSLNQIGYFNNNVRITPRTIVEDSRCAVQVSCIQAGRVVVEGNITTNSGTYTLSMSTDGGVYTLNDGSRVQIIEVTPLKYINQTIVSGDYRIKYRVWR